jgi:hypothetical protein
MSVATVEAHRVPSFAIAESSLGDALPVENFGQRFRFAESLSKFILFFLIIGALFFSL